METVLLKAVILTVCLGLMYFLGGNKFSVEGLITFIYVTHLLSGFEWI